MRIMDKQRMTVAEARRLLGVSSDYKLAKIVGRNRASVSRWGRMVPVGMDDLIRLKAKVHK